MTDSDYPQSMHDDQERRIYELNLRSAYSAHERYYADSAQLFQSVLGFADTALKGSAILNGGAAVAMLAFIGALLTSEGRHPVNYAPLVDLLSIFGFGVLLSTLAAGASYFAQMLYYRSHCENELTWDHPYIVNTPQAHRVGRRAVALHVTAVVLVVLSFGSFALGGWQFREFAVGAFSGERAAVESGVVEQEEGVAEFDVNAVVAVSSIVATVVGPITAVLITLRWEQVRRSREERQLILQTLLATRGRHADPGYSWAIRTTPLHFARDRDVLSAHASYMDAVRLEPTAENRERADAEIGRRQGILISEMLKALGYRGLTAEQIEAYTAQGLADREELLTRAMQALPHIAISAKRSADAAEAMLNHVRRPVDEA